jgi:hypothetical protein
LQLDFLSLFHRDQQAAEVDPLALGVSLSRIPRAGARHVTGQSLVRSAQLLVFRIQVVLWLSRELLVLGRRIDPALGHPLVLARLTAPPEHSARSLTIRRSLAVL